METLEARERIYMPGGLGEQYVDSLCELRVAPQDSSMVKEFNKLHVAKIQYLEIDRALRKIVKGDEIAFLAKNELKLEELIQKETQLRARSSNSELKIDSYELRTGFHKEYYECRKLLQEVRCEIRDVLVQVSPQSKLLDEFSRLLVESDLGLEKLEILESSSDEKCLDPRNRVTDQSLLEKTAGLEAKISAEQQKATIGLLYRAFPIKDSSRLLSSTEREVFIDELPESIREEFFKRIKDL